MTSQKTDLKDLEKRLLDVPAAKFREIVKLLEQVRERPEVEDTLATIRPRLTQVRPSGARP